MAETRWEDNVYGMVRREDWIDVGATVPTRQSDPADGLFGDLKTDNIVAKWESLAAEYGIPVMAQFHSFDAEAQATLRVPIDTHNIEKGLIKVKINQSERLRALVRSGVQGDQALYDYVLNDGINLADQVITRTKVAKNEVLATGKVTIAENNLNLTVDYGVPSSQTSYELDLSDDADIGEQIQAIVDDADEAGVTLTGMYTSRKNITKMRANAKIAVSIYGSNGSGALVNRRDLDAYLAEEFGLNTIITNDLNYATPMSVGDDGRPVITQKKYYPQTKVTFFAANPGGRLGVGLWGDAPEVDNGAFYPSGNSQLSPYVYITQKMEWDPAVLWTKASALFIPVLYNPDSLWIATVQEDEGA